MNPSNRENLAEIFKIDPNNSDVRVQKCIDKIQNALEEYGCEVQVSVHFFQGMVQPEIRIIPL